jgi:hypothetical protein
MATQRTRPLAATGAGESSPEPAWSVLPVSESELPAPEEVDPGLVAERDRRFAEGLRALRTGATEVLLGERILMLIGAIVAPLGLLVILIGWFGAAHTALVFEQVPYLISGGLFGLALVFLGAFFYFAHWLTELVKEHRTQSAALLDAIRAVEARLGDLGAAGPVVRSVNGEWRAPPAAGPGAAGPGADVALVATPRGTMAHRPDCAVVATRRDLRDVGDGSGFERCRLCGSPSG